MKILWSSLASNIYLQDTMNDILFIMSNRAVNNSILLTGLDLAGWLWIFLCPWHWFLLDFNVIRNCTQRSLYCLLTRNQRQQREQFRRKVEGKPNTQRMIKNIQPTALPAATPSPISFPFPFPFPFPAPLPDPLPKPMKFAPQFQTWVSHLHVNVKW